MPSRRFSARRTRRCPPRLQLLARSLELVLKHLLLGQRGPVLRHEHFVRESFERTLRNGRVPLGARDEPYGRVLVAARPVLSRVPVLLSRRGLRQGGVKGRRPRVRGDLRPTRSSRGARTLPVWQWRARIGSSSTSARSRPGATSARASTTRALTRCFSPCRSQGKGRWCSTPDVCTVCIRASSISPSTTTSTSASRSSLGCSRSDSVAYRAVGYQVDEMRSDDDDDGDDE